MRRRTALAAGIVALAALAALFLLPEGRREEHRGEHPPPAADEPGPPVLSPAPAPGPPADPSPKPEPSVPAAAVPPPAPPKTVPPVVVAGRVVGLRDEGIRGATVSLFTGEDVAAAPAGSLREFLSDRLRDPRPTATRFTGADGSFRFEIPPAALGSLRAEKEGWSTARVDAVSLAADCDGIRLRLEAPTPIAGVVVSGGVDPVPVEGARVFLLGPAFPPGSGNRRLLGAALSDARGLFEAIGAPPGDADVVVLAKGLKPRLLPRVPVPTEGLEVRLEAAALKSLRGLVFLPDGSTPAPDVRVTATTKPRGRPAEAIQAMQTDRSGRFAFEDLEWSNDGCPLVIEVDGEERGFARLERDPWPGDSDEQIVLEALPDGTLRGRAVEIAPDGTRRPVADVVLRGQAIWESRSWRIPIERSDRTESDGSFEFHFFADRNAAVHLEDRYGPWAVALPVRGVLPGRPSAGPWECEIVLEPSRSRDGEGEVTVAGRVAGPDGGPVAGARVDGFGPGVLTDREGRYALRGRVPREGMKASLRASAEGFLPAAPVEIFLLPGADPTDLWLRFTVPLLPLVGRVLGDDGKPLAGVIVVLRETSGSAGRERESAITGPDGTWRSRGSPGSLWRITVAPRGWMPGKIDQAQAGDPVPDIVLARNPAATPPR